MPLIGKSLIQLIKRLLSLNTNVISLLSWYNCGKCCLRDIEGSQLVPLTVLMEKMALNIRLMSLKDQNTISYYPVGQHQSMPL